MLDYSELSQSIHQFGKFTLYRLKGRSTSEESTTNFGVHADVGLRDIGEFRY